MSDETRDEFNPQDVENALAAYGQQIQHRRALEKAEPILRVLQDAQNRLLRVQQEARRIEADNDAKRTAQARAHEAEQTRLDEANAALRAEQVQLRGETEHLRAERDGLQAEVTALRTEKAELEAAIDAAEAIRARSRDRRAS